jgi:hypothetical protein
MSQIPLSQSASADRPDADERREDQTRQIARDVAYRQIAIVNVIFYGPAGAGDWAMGPDRCRRYGIGVRDTLRSAGTIWAERSTIRDRSYPRPF